MYMFLYGNPVDGHLLVLRSGRNAAGMPAVRVVFYINHRKKHYDQDFSQIIKGFSLFDPLGKWQFQVILGLSVGILVGELLHLDRSCGSAAACLTILAQYW